MTEPREITCDRCGKQFTTTVTDAETWDQALDTEPAESLAKGTSLVCTPCYQALKIWAELYAPHLLRKDEP